MKKRFLTLLLAAATTLALALPTYAADTKGLTPQGATQYLSVLDGLLAKYPAATNPGDSATLYADLADMDANGVPELITLWYSTADTSGAAHLDIYTLKNNVAQKTLAAPIPSNNFDHGAFLVKKGGKLFVDAYGSTESMYTYHTYYNMTGEAESIVGDFRLMTPTTTGEITRTVGSKTTRITSAQFDKIADSYAAVATLSHTSPYSLSAAWAWNVNKDASASITNLRAQLAAMSGTPVKQTSSAVTLDGKALTFAAYEIEGSNYFKLRDLAMVLNGTGKQFSVDFNDGAQTIALTTGQAYTPKGGEMTAAAAATTAKKTTQTLLVNGNTRALTAYEIGGNNYFKLRDLAAALDFGVTWDAAHGVIVLSSTTGYDANAKPEAAADEFSALTADRRRALNVFISNFSEAYLASADGIKNLPAEELLRFATRHNQINNYKVLGYHENSYSFTLASSYVDNTLKKYFGFTLPKHASTGDFTYKNGTYSWPAADGEGMQFSVASTYAPRGDGTYAVAFTTYGGDGPELPDIDCYALNPAQAQSRSDLVRNGAGTAIVKPATVDGKSTWQLIGYQHKWN